MSWPLSQDYNEAIQDPRNNFGDAELKTGEAATNALGIPLPRSGNFADVYEIRCPSGSRWAVKCFTRQVRGLRERYHEISKCLRQTNLPFMVDFHYLEQGIRVRGQWYPILKMQWVEGFVLNEFVRDNLDKKPILQALEQIWLRMARRLRETNIAHGDLQHGNVMFVPGSSAHSLAVKLIDYDGMCVPALARIKSGEVGHPAYQHPERLRTGAYNQEMDRFSLLSIAAALRCLEIGGRSLWERYDNGDNLLFRQADLQAPAQSPLFQELLAIRDPQAQTLVKELQRACLGSLDAVPLLTEVQREERPEGKTTTMASAARQTVSSAANWDFSDEGPGGSVVKRRRASVGMPLWVWGAMGGAAALLMLGVALGALALRKGGAEKEGTPSAQIRPTNKTTKSTTKTPPPDNARPRNPPPRAEAFADHSPAHRIFLLSPDGDKLAVSGEEDTSWRLVDASNNAPIYLFEGHEGAITTAAFSSDGRFLLTGSTDTTLRRWDLSNRRWRYWKVNQPVLGVALSADGRRAAYFGESTTINVRDVESNGNNPISFSPGKILSAAFSPDGQQLLVGLRRESEPNQEVMSLWNISSRREVEVRDFYASASAATCVALSPDGKRVAAGLSGERRSVGIWDKEKGKLVQEFPLNSPERIHQLTFSPDSQIILAAFGPSARAWRIADKKIVVDYPQAEADFGSAAFTKDGRQVRFIRCKGDKIFDPEVKDIPK